MPAHEILKFNFKKYIFQYRLKLNRYRYLFMYEINKFPNLKTYTGNHPHAGICAQCQVYFLFLVVNSNSYAIYIYIISIC